MKLTEKKLEELGFVCVRQRDKENDKDGFWGKSGIFIYQDACKGDTFSFATRVDEEGEFKTGYVIKTVEQLEMLFKGLKGTSTMENTEYGKFNDKMTIRRIRKINSATAQIDKMLLTYSDLMEGTKHLWRGEKKITNQRLKLTALYRGQLLSLISDFQHNKF